MWKQDEQAGGEHNIPDDGWWQLRPVGSSRGGEKWPNLGYILTIWLTIFRDGSIRLCKPVASYSSLETHQECVSPVGLDTLSPGWWLGVILILLLLSFVQGGYLAALWGRERLGR